MKHIFILNPAAGPKTAEKKLLPKILEAVKSEGVSYEIHRTMNIGDGGNFVRNRCLAFPEERLRFYAVGGDGTLNEVANGAFGFSNAEIAFIPAGTGNDFARIFSNPQFFLDIKRQLQGVAKPIDLIRYGDRYIVNMLNIGLDCAVVVEMNELKQKFSLKGPFAYMAGVGAVFASNQGYHLKVTLEDGSVYNEEFTLVAVGNGAFCGGGFKGVPRAEIDDGLLDVSLIRKINRRTFASVIGKYRKGTHLEAPVLKDVITYVKCRSLTIEPPSSTADSQETMQICVDGEVYDSTGLNLSVAPATISFSIPEGSGNPL